MDIAAWLRDLGLERYIQAFEANDVDAAVLRTLSADDLKELGVTSLGHRKKLLDGDRRSRPAAIGGSRRRRSRRLTSGRRLRRQEAERRQLTVLFCDLVGSTALRRGSIPRTWGA